VDRVSRDQLIADYGALFANAHLDPAAIPEPDVVDDAATLATFDDGSVDFVIANHVLEHLEDPIAALRNFMRVIRPDGVLFITLPDPAHSFDAGRARTTVEHVLLDHEHGPVTSRQEHYEEWARHIDGATGTDVAIRAAAYARQDARHHFHVWELDGFLELLGAIELPATLEVAQRQDSEFAVIQRRRR
jgi:SAM-dependent methyltransferase